MNIYNTKNDEGLPSQDVYDVYNHFIFSDNQKLFSKILKKIELFNMTKDVPGDIVECWVFKGSGMGLFMKLVKLNNLEKKVIGFDYFNSDQCIKEISNKNDREHMTTVLHRRNFKTPTYILKNI